MGGVFEFAVTGGTNLAITATSNAVEDTRYLFTLERQYGGATAEEKTL